MAAETKRRTPAFNVQAKLIQLRGSVARLRIDFRDWKERKAGGAPMRRRSDDRKGPRYWEREIQIYEDMIADYEEWARRGTETSNE